MNPCKKCGTPMPDGYDRSVLCRACHDEEYRGDSAGRLEANEAVPASPHPAADAYPELNDEHIVRLARRGCLVYRVDHPLEIAYCAAIEQATKGKGERHGGDSIPFYDQQWVTLARCHGPGFLTGQAAKKLNEAAQKTDPQEWEREVLGALVYAGMAILYRWGLPE